MALGAVFLIFWACVDPRHCFEVNGGRFRSIEECARLSQPAEAEWAGDHPGYTVLPHMTCGPMPADEGDEL